MNMIRVISGKYRHREIIQPKSNEVRPTMDVLRSAVFSALGNISSKEVLDVFCGSGAYGIESLSRQAKSVVFIDRLDLCINCVKKTCESLLIDSKDFRVIKADYNLAMDMLKGKRFDIIFADPPYKMDIINEFFSIIKSNDLLNENGCVVFETINDIIDIDGYSVKQYHRGKKKIGIYRKL